MEDPSTSIELKPQRKNFFQKLSRSQKTSFLSLIFIVIILPIATALAMIALALILAPIFPLLLLSPPPRHLPQLPHQYKLALLSKNILSNLLAKCLSPMTP